MRETLITALDLTLSNEGGYANNPNDIGGSTKYGITHNTLAAYRGTKNITPEEIKALTKEEAKDIYQNAYWVQSGGDSLPIGIDYMAFDYSVHSGTAQAVKSLQRVVGAKLDGVMGNQTIKATKSFNGDLITAYAAERLRFMRSLKSWNSFGKGWQKRVETVSEQARHLKSAQRNVPSSRAATGITTAFDKSTFNILKKPDFLAAFGGLLSGLSAIATGSGPIQWALAIIMIGAFLFAIYYFIKRMKELT